MPMLPSGPNTIYLKGGPVAPIYEEEPADGVITPGDAIHVTATGMVRNGLAVAATATAYQGGLLIADTFHAGEVDTDYAAGAPVRAMRPIPGCEFWCWLAPTLTVAKGNRLMYSANGAFKLHDGSAVDAHAIALEGVTADANKTRLRVRSV